MPNNSACERREISPRSERLSTYLAGPIRRTDADDDAAMLRSVVRLLGQLGYDTLPFSSAEAFAGPVDFERAVCVLLDINLGDVSGIELRLRLKAAGNSVPVIYMTGNDSPAVRMAAHQSGCLAYLTKPFSAGSLIEALERATAGS